MEKRQGYNTKEGNHTMTEKNIRLQNTGEIERLCAAAVECPFDIDILSGNYIIDAKSIMGIFALDRSRPLCIRMQAGEAEAADFLDKIADLLA